MKVTLPSGRFITDCGQNCCGECSVCKYLEFLEWAGNVACEGSSIEYDKELDEYIDSKVERGEG